MVAAARTRSPGAELLGPRGPAPGQLQEAPDGAVDLLHLLLDGLGQPQVALVVPHPGHQLGGPAGDDPQGGADLVGHARGQGQHGGGPVGLAQGLVLVPAQFPQLDLPGQFHLLLLEAQGPPGQDEQERAHGEEARPAAASGRAWSGPAPGRRCRPPPRSRSGRCGPWRRSGPGRRCGPAGPGTRASAGPTGNQRPLVGQARSRGGAEISMPSRLIQGWAGGRTNSRVMPGCSRGCRSRRTQGSGVGDDSRLDSSTQAAATATFTWDSLKSSKAARVSRVSRNRFTASTQPRARTMVSAQQPEPAHAAGPVGPGA